LEEAGEDDNDTLEDFTEHVTMCTKAFADTTSTSKYLGGYVVLFQSSGMGKTFLMKRYLQEKGFGVYVNLRPSTQPNFPPRSEGLADWLCPEKLDKSSLALRFSALNLAIVNVFTEWCARRGNPTPERW
jgi:hypothetical protein